MKYSVALSMAGKRDIERITKEIFDASKDKNTTRKYINGLFDKIDSIVNFPKRGAPLIFCSYHTEYRYIRYKVYLIFYRIVGNSIVVDRILFGRSNYQIILSSDRK